MIRKVELAVSRQVEQELNSFEPKNRIKRLVKEKRKNLQNLVQSICKIPSPPQIDEVKEVPVADLTGKPSTDLTFNRVEGRQTIEEDSI